MKNFFHLIILFFPLVLGAQNDTKTISENLQKETESLKSTKPDSLRFWKAGGLFSLAGQQVSLSNWAAGGQNSISAAGMLNLYANYRNGETSWDNNLDLAYGLIKQGDVKNFWKNDDRIQLTSKYGRKAAKNLYYSGLLDFKTQFAPGFNYPNDSVYISDFFAPAYALAAIGMDYKPNSDLSLFLAPLTGKFTIISNQTLADAGAFGVQKATYEIDSNGNLVVKKRGLKHREEFGGYLKFTFKREVMKNVSFNTMLELFSNYLVRAENIDVNWTTLINLRVNKYISATISTHLIYDDDVRLNVDKDNNGVTEIQGPKVQFKQVFGAGLSYKF